MKKIILLIALLTLVFSACSSEESLSPGSANGRSGPGSDSGVQQADVAMSVEGHKVTRRSISQYVITNTSLESIRDVMVYSRVSANVIERFFEEGDVVEEGDVLVRLQDDEIINSLEQARIDLQQAEVAVRQAVVNADQSEADFARVKSLYEQQLISRQEYDQAEITSRSDSLTLENAGQQLEAAKARLQAAEIQLAYTTVKSPISGVVTERLVDVGDRVSANQQLLTLQEFPPLWARIFVPEKSMPKIKIGQLARISMETYPDREFTGRIKLISPTVEAESGTLKVTIEVARDTRLLKPGMFGTVYIATDTHENAVVVPRKSIIRERNANYVFVINDDNTVTRQEVVTGFSEEDEVEIASGLQGNEAIVTVGQETLSDGYPVMVQSWSDGSGVDEVQVADTANPASSEEGNQVSSSSGSSPQARQAVSPGSSQQAENQLPERIAQMIQSNPALKKAWDEKIAEDPEVATDPEKRRAFLREAMSEMRAGGQIPPSRGMGGGRP